MYRFYPYDYDSQISGCHGRLYDDRMTITDPDGNVIYDIPWHCGEDYYSKGECRWRTDTYPKVIQQLKELEKEIKDEFGINE